VGQDGILRTDWSIGAAGRSPALELLPFMLAHYQTVEQASWPATSAFQPTPGRMAQAFVPVSVLISATTLPRILRPLPFTSFFHFLPLIPNHFPLPPAMSLQSPCYL
jgi:hypothetical protein